MQLSEEETPFQENQLDFAPAIVRAFTKGDCWRLALDLHKKLGYPVYVVTELEIVLNDNPAAFFHHMVVMNPVTGKFIDVDGEHTETQLLSQYGTFSESTVLYEIEVDQSLIQDCITAFVEFDESLLGDTIIKRLSLTKTSSESDSILTLI